MNIPTTQPFRQLRRASGVSIRTLSTLTGINRGRLSIIERGVMPTPDEARLIVEALTLTPKPEASGTPESVA